MLTVGGICLAAAQLGSRLAESIIREAAPAEIADLIVGLISAVLGMLATQSVILLAVGVGLVALGVTIRRDLVLEDWN